MLRGLHGTRSVVVLEGLSLESVHVKLWYSFTTPYSLNSLSDGSIPSSSNDGAVNPPERSLTDG